MENINYKVYVAAPIVGITSEQSEKINEVHCKINQFFNGSRHKVYNPAFLQIPNAWNMPLAEWGRCVFTCDVLAIDQSDWVVVCDFGRIASAGTCWETGYAFGKGKKILRIWMGESDEESLMMACGTTLTMKFEDFIREGFDFPDKMEKFKNVETEVKLH